MQVIRSCFILCADRKGCLRYLCEECCGSYIETTCHKQSLIDIVNTGLDSICGTHPSIFSLSHHEDHNLGVERRFTLPSFVDVVMTFDLKPRLSILLSLDEVSPTLQQKT